MPPYFASKPLPVRVAHSTGMSTRSSKNAPIGFRFPAKPADPALEQAIVNEVVSLRRANPGVNIRLEW